MSSPYRSSPFTPDASLDFFDFCSDVSACSRRGSQGLRTRPWGLRQGALPPVHSEKVSYEGKNSRTVTLIARPNGDLYHLPAIPQTLSPPKRFLPCCSSKSCASLNFSFCLAGELFRTLLRRTKPAFAMPYLRLFFVVDIQNIFLLPLFILFAENQGADETPFLFENHSNVHILFLETVLPPY